MELCTRACACASVCVHTRLCVLCVHIHSCVLVRTCVRAHTFMCIGAHVCTYIHVYWCARVCVRCPSCDCSLRKVIRTSSIWASWPWPRYSRHSQRQSKSACVKQQYFIPCCTLYHATNLHYQCCLKINCYAQASQCTDDFWLAQVKSYSTHCVFLPTLLTY